MKHYLKKYVPTICFVTSALISMSVMVKAQDKDLRIVAGMLIIFSVSALIANVKGPDEED